MKIGGVSGPRASFVCGFLGVTQGWLSEFPRQRVTECQRPSGGGVTVLTRMAELMFVEVMRRHIHAAPVAPTGWLTGLRDPVVGPVLGLLHKCPAHPWNLAGLAQKAATSRTVLAERFSQTIAFHPMHYLAQWRLQLAAREGRAIGL